YLGINFGNPACFNVANERTMCWGGTTWGKPCSTTGDCTGAAACAGRPWNWIFDHLVFQNWSYIDPSPTANSTTKQCSEQVLGLGAVHGCANNDVSQGVTIQNSIFQNNFGAGALGQLNAGGQRWFHNKILNNFTHGYTSSMNVYVPKDSNLAARSYYW